MNLFKMTLASLILASTAHAATPPVFERMRVSVYIYKNTIERVGDDFKWNEEEICRKTLTMNVEDLRESKGSPTPLASTVCETTFEGQPMHLSLISHAFIDRISLRGHSEVSEVKTYYSQLTAYSDKPLTKYPVLPSPNSTFTKDLNLKNLIYNQTPNQGVICMEQSGPGLYPTNNFPTTPAPDNCAPFNPVAFGAVVEFETL